MEFSEKCIKQLEGEGFSQVYEWRDAPGTVYPPHEHKGNVSMYVTDGSISFEIEGKKRDYISGERIDVPPQKEHSAVVGPDGWQVVVGEEVEGDS